ncbi:hypothetical protein M440DRAFT_1378463, partial [Trichoderma longibrachiatum ATCC 18648]
SALRAALIFFSSCFNHRRWPEKKLEIFCRDKQRGVLTFICPSLLASDYLPFFFFSLHPKTLPLDRTGFILSAVHPSDPFSLPINAFFTTPFDSQTDDDYDIHSFFKTVLPSGHSSPRLASR